MAGKSLFDNIVFVWRGEIVLDDAIVSVLVDLDLPIGYAAEIVSTKFRLMDLGNLDIDPSRQTDVRAALVKDPDDETTTEIPAETISHDVVADAYLNNLVIENAGATEVNAMETPRHTEEVNLESRKADVISARDLRFNAVASHASENLGMDMDCTVRYCLKKLGQASIDQLIQLLT